MVCKFYACMALYAWCGSSSCFVKISSSRLTVCGLTSSPRAACQRSQRLRSTAARSMTHSSPTWWLAELPQQARNIFSLSFHLNYQLFDRLLDHWNKCAVCSAQQYRLILLSNWQTLVPQQQILDWMRPSQYIASYTTMLGRYLGTTCMIHPCFLKLFLFCPLFPTFTLPNINACSAHK